MKTFTDSIYYKNFVSTKFQKTKQTNNHCSSKSYEDVSILFLTRRSLQNNLYVYSIDEKDNKA